MKSDITRYEKEIYLVEANSMGRVTDHEIVTECFNNTQARGL